ncbi:MAG: hypothetical protein CMJ18_03410, partial [Phycisphaeraceae bacterium]|nr:hypothetical protein [Phycisphaeraceae bacterium]
EFKIRKLKVERPEGGCYENLGTVVVPGASDHDLSHYCNPDTPDPDPGIDIEKLTNGVDADTEADAPLIAPGDLVTWTYKVTNTGNVAFGIADVVVTDDHGTPGDDSDDFHPTLDASSDDGGDMILSPGEMWIYEAHGVAEQQSSGGGESSLFVLTGNSSLDGPNGNIRSFAADGVSVNASAFSRTSGGSWSEAFLGSYGSGLGVTNNDEGNGGNGTHRVDNLGNIDYVLFEFSESVVVDGAFLGSVVDDSDISIWIGTVADAFNSHNTLSDAFLGGLGFSEDNMTGSGSDRFADFNAGDVVGNVLVIAAWTDDPSPEDEFKIRKLKVERPEGGCYENLGTVVVPGASDHDLSHYCTPVGPAPDPGIDIEKYTNGADADTEAEAVEIAAGEGVTWSYLVTNTGNVPFELGDVNVNDDNGTPDDPSDDFSPELDATSDDGGDGVLSPGELWIYNSHGTAMDLLNEVDAIDVRHPTPRPVFGNEATVTAGSASDSDMSHYRNPDRAFGGDQATSDLTVGDVVFNGRSMSVTLTNHGTEDLVIEEILMSWGSGNRRLRKVKVDGRTIYRKRTVSSAEIDNFRGGEGRRTIGAGETITLTFYFERTASTDLSEYDLTIGVSGMMVEIL